MANQERGDVSFEVAGRTYCLKLDLNALCELEGALSTGIKQVSFQDALRMVERKHITATRAMFWAALRAHHPDMTMSQVGDLMLAMVNDKGFADIEATLQRAVKASMPTKEDRAAQGRPHEARRNGRGARSSSGPGASV